MPSQTDTQRDVTKAQVLRAIEQLKANEEGVYPSSVARVMGISRSVFYGNLDILDVIYRYGSEPVGADIVIQELVSKLRSAERKVKRLEKKLVEAELNAKKSYSEGFSSGAALNYSKPENETENQIDYAAMLAKVEEDWARGVLFIDAKKELDEELIKTSYRKLIQVMHPDKSKQNTEDLVHTLNQAYELLLENCAQ